MSGVSKYTVRPFVCPSVRGSTWSYWLAAAARFVITLVRRIIPSRLLRVLCDDSAAMNSTTPIEGMMVVSVEQPPENELQIVSSLMASFRAAKEAQQNAAEPYLPGADWKRMLESEWLPYYEAIEEDNVSLVATMLRNFFRNEGLSGFWGRDRMFDRFTALNGRRSIARAQMMRRQYDAWHAALPAVPVGELEAPRIGNPWGYVIEDRLLYEPVFEYNYQAHQFARLLRYLRSPIILEIGGGFGGLAYHILKRIPGAQYIGFDLPENMLLQNYYLRCAFPELRVLSYSPDVLAISRKALSEYDIALLPNFLLPQVESEIADLVINVRSLSEMLPDTISEYLRQIERVTRVFFFHENICKKRLDDLHGIPTSEFPAMEELLLLSQSESRWPRYNWQSTYPCSEYLSIKPGECRHFRAAPDVQAT